MTIHSTRPVTTRHPNPRPLLLRVILRVLSAVGWTVLALFAYFVCQGTFGGYPQFHSAALTTAGMVAISLTGGITWLVDERRPHDD
jgi:hypothetical protein